MNSLQNNYRTSLGGTELVTRELTIQKPLEVIELLDGVNCEVAETRRHGR
jgi:hypothetical protein